MITNYSRKVSINHIRIRKNPYLDSNSIRDRKADYFAMNLTQYSFLVEILKLASFRVKKQFLLFNNRNLYIREYNTIESATNIVIFLYRY